MISTQLLKTPKLSTNVKNHLIGNISGDHDFPTIVVFGGIHGNEPAGVTALENVIKTILELKIPLHGNLYAVKGNLAALKNGKRFIDKDLNRIWTRRNVAKLQENQENSVEIKEQKELHAVLKHIFQNSIGPYYFIDLHTTSSYTKPFITISDSLNNRKFSSKFKLPIILGIEEYLEGPLLTFLNEFGHVSLGFEAGQHNDESSVTNCEHFIWQTLVNTRCVSRKHIPNYRAIIRAFKFYKSVNFYHIKEKHELKENEDFQMLLGYTNFQTVNKGEKLAISNGYELRANRNGKIFMPLYQKQGDDGYFIIKRVSKFWLGASIILRKINAHELLRLLPGVKKQSKNTLRVNPKTARFLTNQIFHLFGYRKRVRKGNRWFYTKRDRKIERFI